MRNNKHVVDNRTIAQTIYKADIMLAIYKNMKKTGQPWQWTNPAKTKDGRECDDYFNQTLDPDSWDYDWKRHTDFSTDIGIARLRAWIGFNNNTNHLPTCPTYTDNKLAITEYGEDWVPAEWFRCRTAITYPAGETCETEKRYVTHVMMSGRFQNVLLHNSEPYVNIKDAPGFIGSINNDIADITPFTDWVRANSEWYSKQYQPETHPEEEEEW